MQRCHLIAAYMSLCIVKKLPVATLPLTTDTLEAFVPFNCYTILTPNNEDSCQFGFTVIVWPHDLTRGMSIWTSLDGTSRVSGNESFTGVHKATIILSSGVFTVSGSYNDKPAKKRFIAAASLKTPDPHATDFRKLFKKDIIELVEQRNTICLNSTIKPLLRQLAEEQLNIFYYVRNWCLNKKFNGTVEPIRLFTTGGAGTGKTYLSKCMYYEASKILTHANNKIAEEIRTLICTSTNTTALNTNSDTIHANFMIGEQMSAISESQMNTLIKIRRLNDCFY
ncbi:unnamed protein product [Didymodactylos carnosus]|uniref:ATP-dependent DNA helicase n=1 Tax=Didymodactylos carnosus TaxID=1234261 RepID=A0A813Z3M8_9BILA|nr:unnamed protein product [Didymodactylos carnosus]CAF3676471.1 unnamed protein product [Didymodactylos carnosus]